MPLHTACWCFGSYQSPVLSLVLMAWFLDAGSVRGAVRVTTVVVNGYPRVSCVVLCFVIVLCLGVVIFCAFVFDVDERGT